MKNPLQIIIAQAVDIHMHIGPEPIPRKYSVRELIKSENNKIAGFVLKNHFMPTSPFIKTENNKQLILYGGIVLNNSVGGLNSDAILIACQLSDKPIVVWFPTINAKNFLAQSKFEIAPEWINDKKFISKKSSDVKPVNLLNKGKLTVEAITCLKTIKKCKAILATGHISPIETTILVNQALALGISKIVITHPIYQKIEMTNELQKEFANKGCFIEIPYSMYSIDKIPITKIIEEIKSVGFQNIILSSDMGQVYSPAPSVALGKFAQLLIASGIKEKELFRMLVENPKKLLDIR